MPTLMPVRLSPFLRLSVLTTHTLNGMKLDMESSLIAERFYPSVKPFKDIAKAAASTKNISIAFFFHPNSTSRQPLMIAASIVPLGKAKKYSFSDKLMIWLSLLAMNLLPKKFFYYR